jgi:hypothetical protein
MEGLYKDTVVLDTIIRRDSVPEHSEIRLDPVFASRNGLPPMIHAAPFRDEDGGKWYGAVYDPLPASAGDRKVLARLGSEPVITVQNHGKGRVYWIGQNLVWHAYIHENATEQLFLQAVFEEGLGVKRP